MKIVLVTLRRLIHEVLLLEDRVSDAKKKYPELEKEIDELVSSDPSGSQKYLLWGVKQLSMGASINDLIPTIEFFHKNGPKFKNRDINAYKTLKELEDELKSITPTKTQERKATKESGVEKMGEDNDYELVHIKNRGASQLYGSGTKWCITMKEHSYFERYTGANVVFYFALSKTLPKTNHLYKVAFAAQRDVDNSILEVDIFDAEDVQLDEVPDELKDLLKIVEQDAPKREMSMLAKIKNNIATEKDVEQALKLYEDDVFMLKSILECDAAKPFLVRFVHHDRIIIRHVVAKNIDVEFLPQMTNDDSFDVYSIVFERIDPSHIPHVAKNANRDVRERAVRLINQKYVPLMIDDEDAAIREIVAQRIDRSYLPRMMNDPDKFVRAEVAFMIDKSYLPMMMHDESDRVRNSVVDRIDPKYLPEMMHDESSIVRLAVARLIDKKYLHKMVDDVDNRVRMMVVGRMRG
jgi:hypothetical protein